MLVVYALAAVISMAVAWIIKFVDARIRNKNAANEPGKGS